MSGKLFTQIHLVSRLGLGAAPPPHLTFIAMCLSSELILSSLYMIFNLSIAELIIKLFEVEQH
jgi:hypothetical protein